MNYWLEADPEDILDEVILARQLAGEDLDETSSAARKMVLGDIRSAQASLLREVVEVDGMVPVFRSIRLETDQIEGFENKGLGTCWALSRAGAFAYDGRRSGVELIMEARVASDDIVWPMVIGMWSSGEGEARIAGNAVVLLDRVLTSDGDPVREDMWGGEFSAGRRLEADRKP